MTDDNCQGNPWTKKINQKVDEVQEFWVTREAGENWARFTWPEWVKQEDAWAAGHTSAAKHGQGLQAEVEVLERALAIALENTDISEFWRESPLSPTGRTSVSREELLDAYKKQARAEKLLAKKEEA